MPRGIQRLKNVEVERSNAVPNPPFIGQRHVFDIDPAKLFSYVNEQALFRGRWGYRRLPTTSAEEYAELIRTKVAPMYEDLKARSLSEGLLLPKAAYGYFRCYSEGDAVYVEAGGETIRFAFPRQVFPPHLCIADYYKTRDEGGTSHPFSW
ncbi:hypothetical protein [Syntrophotalea acetylenivorans]|uniref:hypothetical protein n=1 Tax=Syntrophotalea acetylenivorans TaxID=1842532 RepID=UPI001912CCD7|nr:hypothetical protein [Syntrophotalea acetylenivorans]